MRNKTKMFGVLAMGVLLMAFLPLVSPAECGGQSCGADVNLTIGNEVPTIPYVSPVSAITLTGLATKEVVVQFNATDQNGFADLDFATPQVELVKGAVTRTSSSCSAILNTTFTTTFECTVDLNFYDVEGADWVVNASVYDVSATYVENSSTVATVNSLDYVDADVSAMDWASATLGVDDVEVDSPLTIQNGGNQVYPTVNIMGYNATGVTFGNVIPASVFSVHSLTGQTTTQTYMVDSTNVDVSSVIDLNSIGASETETIYAYVDVPLGIQADTYLSDSSWSILVTAI